MSIRLIVDNDAVGDIPHVPTDFGALSAEHHQLTTNIEQYQRDTVPLPLDDQRVSKAEQQDYQLPGALADPYMTIFLVGLLGAACVAVPVAIALYFK